MNYRKRQRSAQLELKKDMKEEKLKKETNFARTIQRRQVDEDIDIADPVRVEWAMVTRWQPDKDTIILSNQKGSSLDPSRNPDGTTSKVGFDATISFDADKSGFMSVQ